MVSEHMEKQICRMVDNFVIGDWFWGSNCSKHCLCDLYKPIYQNNANHSYIAVNWVPKSQVWALFVWFFNSNWKHIFKNSFWVYYNDVEIRRICTICFYIRKPILQSRLILHFSTNPPSNEVGWPNTHN